MFSAKRIGEPELQKNMYVFIHTKKNNKKHGFCCEKCIYEAQACVVHKNMTIIPARQKLWQGPQLLAPLTRTRFESGQSVTTQEAWKHVHGIFEAAAEHEALQLVHQAKGPLQCKRWVGGFNKCLSFLYCVTVWQTQQQKLPPTPTLLKGQRKFLRM